MTFKKIIVQGMVIYTYRLALHGRRILREQLTAFPWLHLPEWKETATQWTATEYINCKPWHSNTELLKILFLRKCGYFQDFPINIIMFQIHKFALHSVLHLENQHLHEGTVHIRLFSITRKKIIYQIKLLP